MNPLVRQSATAAGFAADAELDSKLTVFALLVQQQRNRELMKMMQQYMRQDIGVCADTCRAVGHTAAANWLQAHADSLTLDWDAITVMLLNNLDVSG